MNLRSPGATKLIGTLALVVVAALGWLLVLGPQSATLSDVRTATDDTRAQNETLRQQLLVLKKQEELLPETRAAAQALAAKFPATADQPGLFAAVTEAASYAGIPARDVTALTPTPPVVGAADTGTGVPPPTDPVPGDLATQIVTVSVSGTYDETQQLLANLEQMTRAYLVTSLTVSGGAETDLFTTTITGDMFVMPPAEDPRADPARSASGGR
jgi:hypothetical protein